MESKPQGLACEAQRPDSAYVQQKDLQDLRKPKPKVRARPSSHRPLPLPKKKRAKAQELAGFARPKPIGRKAAGMKALAKPISVVPAPI